jgi:integrase
VTVTERGRHLLEAHRHGDDERPQAFYAEVSRPRELSHDAQLEWLRLGPNSNPVPDDRLVFLRQDGETVKSFRTAWERARAKAGLPTVRFHDLRSEYASRLVECGVLLSQVRDLLGHCSIIVTERYDRVRLDSLKAAVARLDNGQPFKNLSSPADQLDPVKSLRSTA